MRSLAFQKNVTKTIMPNQGLGNPGFAKRTLDMPFAFFCIFRIVSNFSAWFLLVKVRRMCCPILICHLFVCPQFRPFHRARAVVSPLREPWYRSPHPPDDVRGWVSGSGLTRVNSKGAGGGGDTGQDNSGWWLIQRGRTGTVTQTKLAKPLSLCPRQEHQSGPTRQTTDPKAANMTGSSAAVMQSAPSPCGADLPESFSHALCETWQPAVSRSTTAGQLPKVNH